MLLRWMRLLTSQKNGSSMQFKASKPEFLVEATKARRDEILRRSQVDLESWIDENVESLDDVRAFLKRLARAVKANMDFE